jgi:hypothetical protein
MDADIDTAIGRMGLAGLETSVTDVRVYEVCGSWSEHVRSWTARPHRSVIVVRYEDLLADPLRNFALIARHLMMSATPVQIGEAVARSSFERLRAQEEARGFKEKPDGMAWFFRSGRSGAWRERLNRRQVRRIVRDHGEQMARFGYLSEDISQLAG